MAFPTTAIAAEVPPFFDILDEYGLSHYDHYIVTQDSSNNYYVYTVPRQYTLRDNSNAFSPSGVDDVHYSYCFKSPNYYLKPTSIKNGSNTQYVYNLALTGSIVFSSYDVKRENGAAVFQQSPSIQTAAGTVKGAIMTTDLTRSMSELVALLPVLIPCMICFLSIRKGLKFTFRMLRQS